MSIWYLRIVRIFKILIFTTEILSDYGWGGGVKYIFIIRKRETNWQEKQAFHDNCRTIYLHIYSIARQFNHFGEVLVGICMHLNYTLLLLLHLYMCKL